MKGAVAVKHIGDNRSSGFCIDLEGSASFSPTCLTHSLGQFVNSWGFRDYIDDVHSETVLQVAKELAIEAGGSLTKKEYDEFGGLVRNSDATKLQVGPLSYRKFMQHSQSVLCFSMLSTIQQ